MKSRHSNLVWGLELPSSWSPRRGWRRPWWHWQWQWRWLSTKMSPVYDTWLVLVIATQMSLVLVTTIPIWTLPGESFKLEEGKWWESTWLSFLGDCITFMMLQEWCSRKSEKTWHWQYLRSRVSLSLLCPLSFNLFVVLTLPGPASIWFQTLGKL